MEGIIQESQIHYFKKRIEMSVVIEWLDDLLCLLEYPSDKGLHGSKIKKYRETDPDVKRQSELKSEMFRGQVGNSEAVKKGHQTRKINDPNGECAKRAAEKRKEWYKDEANMAKFKKQLAHKRDKNRQKKGE